MKKHFFWLLIAIFLVGSTAYAKQKNYPVLTENGKSYYLYTVQKSEGLYAISQRFSVPQSLIIEANPGIEQGLILGQMLKVPKMDPSETKKKEPVQLGKNQHLVKAKETLYSLSKRYNCTVDELLELNPWATNLTIGSVLQIPTKDTSANNASDTIAAATQVTVAEDTDASTNVTSETNHTENQEAPAKEIKKKKNIWSWFSKKNTSENQNAATSDAIVSENEEIEEPEFIAKESHIKVGILLPFMLDSINRDASMDRFVEFYQGCLIAADSLANTGLSTEIYAFDTGKDNQKLYEILSNPLLKEVDIIIGPAYQNQVSIVADFAYQYRIPTIIPFSSNITNINQNPYLFEVVTPQKELYKKLVDKCTALFADKHVIIAKPVMLAQYNKADFATLLMNRLNNDSIRYSIINDAKLAHSIDSVAALYPNKECVVVMPSTHGVALNKLGEAFNQLKQSNVGLFGFPEWNNLGIDELYEKNMYQFSSYYTSFTDPAVIEFYYQLRDKFGVPKNIQQSPNFAIFGYDICLYFMKQYQLHGDRFINYMPETETSGLQMNFLFEQVDNGGYWNVGTIIKQINKDGISDL